MTPKVQFANVVLQQKQMNNVDLGVSNAKSISYHDRALFLWWVRMDSIVRRRKVAMGLVTRPSCDILRVATFDHALPYNCCIYSVTLPPLVIQTLQLNNNLPSGNHFATWASTDTSSVARKNLIGTGEQLKALCISFMGFTYCAYGLWFAGKWHRSLYQTRWSERRICTPTHW